MEFTRVYQLNTHKIALNICLLTRNIRIFPIISHYIGEKYPRKTNAIKTQYEYTAYTYQMYETNPPIHNKHHNHLPHPVARIATLL